MTDILFPFARVVSKRESGVLNTHQLIADIFEDYREGEMNRGYYDFIKKNFEAGYCLYRFYTNKKGLPKESL